MSYTNTALRFVLSLDKSSQRVRREFSIVLSIYSCTCRRSGFQLGHTRRTLLDEILSQRPDGGKKLKSTAWIWLNEIKWTGCQIGQNNILACCVCRSNTVVSFCICSVIQMTKFAYDYTYDKLWPYNDQHLHLRISQTCHWISCGCTIFPTSYITTSLQVSAVCNGKEEMDSIIWC